ncbi:recombinase family protein [Pseudonocardia sp. CA-142604]|uniref:recombinase family protein n=1 Tax=Pseudonocardia sp. CA-142604 TaxID=3240024 RepID=UPI003D9194F2
MNPASADVVRRIFREYLEGSGDRAIAGGLNRDDVPCPSVRRPDQNRHRLADGWQGSTVRAILENPRYTGYAVFGRWSRNEELSDPDDVAAGHVVRFRRSSPDQVVRSRVPAHPAIVSVETFTEVQLMRRTKAAGGLEARRTLERGPRPTKRTYCLRGRVRCGYCRRRMEGTPRGERIYYRCAARSIVPGSPILETHPKNVYLPEAPVLEPINTWIGSVFDPARRDETVRRLLGVAPDQADDARTADAERAVAEAETKLRRLQAAIEAGADPAALIDPLNRAQEQLTAARLRCEQAPALHRLG